MRAGKGIPVFAETPGGQAGVGTHGVPVPGGLCRTEHAPRCACQLPGLAWGCQRADLPAELLRGAGLGAGTARDAFCWVFLREGAQLL